MRSGVWDRAAAENGMRGASSVLRYAPGSEEFQPNEIRQVWINLTSKKAAIARQARSESPSRRVVVGYRFTLSRFDWSGLSRMYSLPRILTTW